MAGGNPESPSGIDACVHKIKDKTAWAYSTPTVNRLRHCDNSLS